MGTFFFTIFAELGLVCHNEYIEVTLESKNYPGLDTNVTHLQDEACVPGYRDATKVIFRFGLGDCETEYEDYESEIRYMNKIIAVVNDENEEEAITRSSTRVLPFQCSYKKKAVISKVRVNPQFTKIITNTGNNNKCEYNNAFYCFLIHANGNQGVIGSCWSKYLIKILQLRLYKNALYNYP